ncbi:MAG: T9SS type A sorting domain-containing protein [bacterium]
MCAKQKDFCLLRPVLFVLILLFFTGTGFSQITWRRVYGGASYDEAYSVDQTTDGGYIVTGRTHSFGNGAQIYLIRVDPWGDTIWTRTYGGGGRDWGMCVRQTADSGFIITGFTDSFGDSLQIYLIKTDSIGDTLWTKTYGGPGNEVGYAVDITQDKGYVIVGGSGFNWAFDPIYLIKTDSLGNVEWNKIYYSDTVYSVGMAVQQTSDGGYIVAGSSTLDGGQVVLIKTDPLGDTLWTKQYAYQFNLVHSVQQTFDGGYIVIGWGPLFLRLFLLRTNSLGDTLWARTYVGPDGGLRGFSGQQTTDGGYIATGKYCVGQESLESVFLLKTDSIGDTLWFKEYRAMLPDAWAYGNSVKQTMDGGYIIAGYTDWIGGANVYLIKTDQDGNVAGIEESGLTHELPFIPQLLTYPNPFFNRVTIKFQIPNGNVGQGFSLAIYDITGRLVRQWDYESATLHGGIRRSDKIIWDGTDTDGRVLSQGVYFCRLEFGRTSVIQKVIKLR